LDRSASLRTEALGALVATLERDLNTALLPAAPAKTEEMTTPPAMQEVEEGESAEVEAEVVEDAAPMYVEEVDDTPAPEQAPGFAVDAGEDAGRGDWVDFNAAPKSNER
jgi:hypothetical protein